MNIQRLYRVNLFILILLLLYNSAGCFFVFKLTQLSLQEEMEYKTGNASHTDEQLTTITFKARDIHTINWLKKGKEFLFNERRYDVVKVEKTIDTHTYWCIADEEEDGLFASFTTKHKSEEKNITLLYPFYFVNKQPHVFFLSIISVISLTPALNQYHMVYREVHHPPPSAA